MMTGRLKDFFSAAAGYVPDAFQRGYHRGFQAMSMTQLSARLAAGQAIDSPSLQKLVGKIAAHEVSIDEHTASPEVQEQMRTILTSENIGRTAINIVKSPRAVFNTLAEALTTELPSFAVAAGALIAGPAAPLTMTAGVTAASAANLYGQEMLSQLRNRNYDVKDAGDITAALSNRFMLAEARDKALVRASIGAGLTLATMGASRIVASVAGVALRTAEDIGKSLLMKTAFRSVGQTMQTLVLHNRLPTAGEYFISQTGGVLNSKMRALPVTVPVYSP